MKKALVLSLFVLTLLIGASMAANAAQTLALRLQSDGTVLVTVMSTPNTNVTLYYMSGSGTREQPLGTTDSTGELQTTVNLGDYGVVTGSSAYVVTGDAINGSRSTSIEWPSPTAQQIAIPFTTLNVSIGQAIVVPISNVGSGSVYVQNVSSPDISVNANDGVITVTGQASGQAIVTICLTGTTSNCQSLTVLVQNGTASSFAFSSPNPVVLAGQSTTIAITGSVNGAFYASSNSNPTVAQVNITNNAITVIGNAPGTTTVQVCGGSNECAPLTVSVIASNGQPISATPTMSPDSVTVAVGQTATVLVAGSGSYTAASNNVNIATANLINSTNLVITGVLVGRATASACDSSNDCGYVSVTVTPAPVVTTTTSTPVTTTATSASGYQFTTYLSPGSQGDAVTALQRILASEGYLSVTPTGYYGAATENAVIAFQAAHGLDQLGVVGPATRAALNALGSSTTASASSAGTVGDGYLFSNFIGTGSTGTDVTELQTRLTSLGVYTGPITGYFGSLTAAAVARFQGDHSIPQAGYVGPATRAALNAN